MVFTVSTADPRSLKALAILETADCWQQGHTRGGRPFYAVPSQSAPNAYHMADCCACTCKDFERRQEACKHVLAVRLHVARLKGRATPRPARHGAEQVAAASAEYVALFGGEA